jgi:hypothetical protein
MELLIPIREMYMSRKLGRFVFSVILVVLIISVSLKYYMNYKRNNIDKINIQVEVLNACGVPSLATLVARIIRNKGYDVVDISNHSHTAKTVVWDRLSPEGKYAKIVAKDIGCKYTSIKVDSLLFVKVTVIVGEDYWDLFGKEIKELGYDRSLKRRKD